MEFRWSTIGHDSVKQYFETCVSSGRLPAHGFIFAGPEHIGKTTFVYELVSILMCEGSDTRPCGSCIHCVHGKSHTHPDIYRVTKPEDRASITVEDIRDVIEQLHTSSFFKQKKICIIEDAHVLTSGASNALLKSLEEPSGETIFLLITHSEQALLQTIKSRCQMIRMYPVAQKLVYDTLIARGIQAGVAHDISRYASGRLGLVWELMQHPESWSSLSAEVNRQTTMFWGKGYEKNEWYEHSDGIPFEHFVGYAHDALVSCLGLPEHTRGGKQDIVSEHTPLPVCVNLLKSCADAICLRSKNVNAKLVLDSIHVRVRDVVYYSK